MSKNKRIAILATNGFEQSELMDPREKLKKAGATSLVLDLRNNPGGLLTAAVDVASYFLGDGKLIVYTQGRRAENRQDDGDSRRGFVRARGDRRAGHPHPLAAARGTIRTS